MLAGIALCGCGSDVRPSVDAHTSAFDRHVPSSSCCSGPLCASANPNYFQDATGRPLILCGSQTWNTLQDWGTDGAAQAVDFDAFVGFLRTHGHNFTLLWFTELPVFRGLPSAQTNSPDFTVRPFPWLRTGPGQATDGGLRFDLTKFDPAYFERLRLRVQTLNHAGIYVGVYVFTAEFVLRFRSARDGYPFSGPNNINGIDDGYRGGPPESGLASLTMISTNAMTDLQDAYVRKLIDTLNDLPNVLWITSEEAPSGSQWWNAHLIALIREYEKGKRWQHPIGYAVLADMKDATLCNSDADWIAPGPAMRISPERTRGTGNPACKVNINDSDHTYWGLWNDTPQANRNYIWENFTMGNQVLFMDPYLVHYPRQRRNLCSDPVHGIGRQPDARYENVRNSLGNILRFSRRLNLARVVPCRSLCSTGFCLAQIPPRGAEYLVYAPAGGPLKLDLSAMSAARNVTVEWFNPETGETTQQGAIAAGSPAQTFRPPFPGDAVLYVVDSEGHRDGPSPAIGQE